MVDLGLQCISTGFPTVFFLLCVAWELSNGQLPVGLGNGGSSHSQMRSVMTEVPAHTETQSYGCPQVSAIQLGLEFHN